MTIVKVYIAGPMTGLPDFNYPAFFAAAEQLDAAGYDPINPARMREGLDYQGAGWLDYMRHSLRDIAEADAIALLPGWQESRGARIEADLGNNLGLDVFPLQHWLTAKAAG